MEGATLSRRLLAAITLAGLATSAGCTSSVGTTAASMLRKVKESPDPNVRYTAYAKLASPRVYDDDTQKTEVAEVLSKKLATGSEPVASRVAIIRTLGELGRPEARGVILRAVNDHDESAVRAAACRALGRVGAPDDWTVLAQVMAGDPELDCRIAAVEGLSAMKIADPRLDLMLVDGMEHTEPAIRLASLQALKTLSGQDLGPEPAAWKKYAEERMKVAAPAKEEKPSPTARG
jgi:HEAT repeat protein